MTPQNTADTAGAAARKRGRPLEEQPEQVLDRIRDLSRRGALFRVHRENPSLYARARRLFGSWSAAVQRAGASYEDTMEQARRRSIETRRRMREASFRATD